jgi:membrane-associated phospholipid phosphatase
MKEFVVTLPRNLVGCFKGWKLAGHAAAMLLTFILAASGFDWFYFCHTRRFWPWMFPAAIIGMFLPVVLPLVLLAAGRIYNDTRSARAGWAIGQAALIGWLISSVYKAFTGRPHPLRISETDTSHIFQFGFLRGGVFWGWPSSHSATAFAMALAVFTLFPRKRWLGLAAILYAFYIGLGVSMTIHWFSDFAAGAIIGTIAGITVGKSFLHHSVVSS